MRCPARDVFLVAGAIAAAGLGLSPQVSSAADAKGEPTTQAARDTKEPEAKRPADAQSWRYVRHDGQWWYWLPQGRWVYWEDNRWKPYAASEFIEDRAMASTRRRGSAARGPEEVRPFYGHAQSNSYSGRSQQEEIGPYYGNALPRDVFGSPIVPRFRRGPF
jgi:hypothetical protein